VDIVILVLQKRETAMTKRITTDTESESASSARMHMTMASHVRILPELLEATRCDLLVDDDRVIELLLVLGYIVFSSGHHYVTVKGFRAGLGPNSRRPINSGDDDV